MREDVNQYEACDRILEYVVGKQNEWISPLNIQHKFLKSVPVEKIYFLFDIIAFTRPEPVSVQRSMNGNYWVIKKNSYTEEFLKEGGFTATFLAEKSEFEEEKKVKELEREKLELETENLKYKQTIRHQEQRIRDLNEQNSLINLMRNYWWLLIFMLGVGYSIGKAIEFVMGS